MQESNQYQFERRAERARGGPNEVPGFLWALLGLALLMALPPVAGYGDSESAQEHFRRGTNYLQLHQLDKAESEFLECLQISPELS